MKTFAAILFCIVFMFSCKEDAVNAPEHPKTIENKDIIPMIKEIGIESVEISWSGFIFTEISKIDKEIPKEKEVDGVLDKKYRFYCDSIPGAREYSISDNYIDFYYCDCLAGQNYINKKEKKLYITFKESSNYFIVWLEDIADYREENYHHGDYQISTSKLSFTLSKVVFSFTDSLVSLHLTDTIITKNNLSIYGTSEFKKSESGYNFSNISEFINQRCKPEANIKVNIKLKKKVI